MKKLFIILLIIFGFSSIAFSATYTLTNADGETIDGDTFCSGTCPAGTIFEISSARTAGLVFYDLEGAEGNEIIIRNQSSSKATITSLTSVRPANIYLNGCSHVKIEGDNYGSETYGIWLTATGGAGIRLYDCDEIEIHHVKADGPNGGVTQNATSTTQSTTFTGWSIHDNYFTNIGNEAIYLGKSESGDYPQFSGIQIYDNIITAAGWDCIQLGQTVAASGSKIYGNTLNNCGAVHEPGQGFGIILNPEANDVEVYQNWVKQVWEGGIQAHSSSSGPNIHDNKVIDTGNRTDTDRHGIAISTTSGTISIINNTVVDSAHDGIKTSGGSGSVQYNLVAGWGDSALNITGQSTNQNYTNASIAAVNFDSNYDLEVGSPAINNSDNSAGYSTTDYYGNTRPAPGTYPDPGAMEYTPSKISNASPPDDATDVGLTTDLTWSNPGTIADVDVYFEKISGACDLQAGDLVVENGVDTETYDTGTMDEQSEYCWRVDLDGVTGDVYSFTTTDVIPPTTGLAPAVITSGGTPAVISSGGIPVVVGE